MIETGSLRGQRFLLPLAPNSLVLGRDASCGVSFPSELDADRLMGRRHAQIDVRTDGVYLLDLHSANGTFVQQGDGQLQPVTSDVRLSSGTRIALGGDDGTWISVELVPEAGSARSSAAAPTHEAPTMRFPPGAFPGWAAATAAQGAVATHAEPVQQEVSPAPIMAARPTPPAPSPPLPSAPPLQPPGQPARRVDEPAVAVADPEQRQQRKILVQQLAVILGLLVLGCGMGLLLGMRGYDPPAAAP